MALQHQIYIYFVLFYHFFACFWQFLPRLLFDFGILREKKRYIQNNEYKWIFSFMKILDLNQK